MDFTHDDIEEIYGEALSLVEKDASLKINFSIPSGYLSDNGIKNKYLKMINNSLKSSAQDFLGKLRLSLRDDICKDGGVINDTIEVRNSDKIKKIIKVALAFGAGNGLLRGDIHDLAMAVAAYVIYIGLNAFCKDA